MPRRGKGRLSRPGTAVAEIMVWTEWWVGRAEKSACVRVCRMSGARGPTMVRTAVSAVTSSTSISSPKVKSSIQSMTFCWLPEEVMRPASGRGDRDMVSKSTTLPLLVVSTVDNPEPSAISSTSFVERRLIRSRASSPVTLRMPGAGRCAKTALSRAARRAVSEW